MKKAKRIQRKRTKGWKMPAGAVYVGRPTRWGNPYSEKGISEYGFQRGEKSLYLVTRRRAAVALFARDCLDRAMHSPREFEEWIAPLRGKDLACWCRPGQECHADVLLALANRRERERKRP